MNGFGKRQLKELETEWEAMNKPMPDQAGLPRFRKFWRVHKDISIIYEYIEYWEDYIKNDKT